MFSIIYQVVDMMERGVHAVVFTGTNKRSARTALGPTQGA